MMWQLMSLEASTQKSGFYIGLGGGFAGSSFSIKKKSEQLRGGLEGSLEAGDAYASHSGNTLELGMKTSKGFVLQGELGYRFSRSRWFWDNGFYFGKSFEKGTVTEKDVVDAAEAAGARGVREETEGVRAEASIKENFHVGVVSRLGLHVNDFIGVYGGLGFELAMIKAEAKGEGSVEREGFDPGFSRFNKTAALPLPLPFFSVGAEFKFTCSQKWRGFVEFQKSFIPFKKALVKALNENSHDVKADFALNRYRVLAGVRYYI